MWNRAHPFAVETRHENGQVQFKKCSRSETDVSERAIVCAAVVSKFWHIMPPNHDTTPCASSFLGWSVLTATYPHEKSLLISKMFSIHQIVCAFLNYEFAGEWHIRKLIHLVQTHMDWVLVVASVINETIHVVSQSSHNTYGEKRAVNQNVHSHTLRWNNQKNALFYYSIKNIYSLDCGN